MTCEDISSNPTEVHGQTLDWVKGDDIRPYLADPEHVADTVLSNIVGYGSL